MASFEETNTHFQWCMKMVWVALRARQILSQKWIQPHQAVNVHDVYCTLIILTWWWDGAVFKWIAH